MVDKIIIFILVIFSAFVLTFSNKPKPSPIADNELLFSNPYFFRAISNISHTLVADWLWLMSADIGEIAARDSHSVETAEFFAASKSITVMDPYFFPAINYAATYLSSIHKDINASIELYETARAYDKNNILLYFNEIVLRATYEEPLDDEVIVRLAKEAAILPSSKARFAKEDINNMIENFIIFARSKKGKEAQAIKDLKWLLKNTTNESRKNEIRKKLDAITH